MAKNTPKKPDAPEALVPGAAGTVQTRSLTTMSMSIRSDSPQIVVHEGAVKEWVGFSWIHLRAATQDDLDTYPLAV